MPCYSIAWLRKTTDGEWISRGTQEPYHRTVPNWFCFILLLFLFLFFLLLLLLLLLVFFGVRVCVCVWCGNSAELSYVNFLRRRAFWQTYLVLKAVTSHTCSTERWKICRSSWRKRMTCSKVQAETAVAFLSDVHGVTGVWNVTPEAELYLVLKSAMLALFDALRDKTW